MNSKFFFQQFKLYKSLAFMFLFGVFFQGGLNAQDFDFIGKEHNRGLKILLPYLNLGMDKTTVTNTARTVLTPHFGPEYFTRFNEVTSSASFEPNLAYIQSHNSAALYQAVSRTINMINNSLTVSQIWIGVDQEYARINLITNLDEREQFTAFLSVVKWSAKMWLPGERGGEAAYLLLGTNFGTHPQEPDTQGFPWGKLILNDAGGCLMGGAGGGPIGATVGLIVGSGLFYLNEMP